MIEWSDESGDPGKFFATSSIGFDAEHRMDGEPLASWGGASRGDILGESIFNIRFNAPVASGEVSFNAYGPVGGWSGWTNSEPRYHGTPMVQLDRRVNAELTALESVPPTPFL